MTRLPPDCNLLLSVSRMSGLLHFSRFTSRLPGALIAGVLFGTGLMSLPAHAQTPAPKLVGDAYRNVERLIATHAYAQALTAADGYLAQHATDPQMRLLKSRILTVTGKTAEAKALLQGLVQDYPEIPEPYNNLAALYAAEGDLGMAREALETAVRLHPRYAIALENLGDLYRRMALDAYERARAAGISAPTLAAKIRAVAP